ncbi:histone H1-like [Penaeus monodon]|uniref:histone H1-like n=1 Tax=Penaeus monodon TaxID=6687 RepID=UPI0018A770AD|nr:histone H1-like [Penaeus monodon]
MLRTRKPRPLGPSFKAQASFGQARPSQVGWSSLPSGLSRSNCKAILRFILTSFQVAGGSLPQTKGVGSSGSFKLSKEELKKAAPSKDSAKKVAKDEKSPGNATALKPRAKSVTETHF